LLLIYENLDGSHDLEQVSFGSSLSCLGYYSLLSICTTNLNGLASPVAKIIHTDRRTDRKSPGHSLIRDILAMHNARVYFCLILKITSVSVLAAVTELTLLSVSVIFNENIKLAARLRRLLHKRCNASTNRLGH